MLRLTLVLIFLIFSVILGCHRFESIPASSPIVPRAPRKILLSFLGDIMAHRPNFEMDDYSRIYHGVSEILLSDTLTFANLETPVDGSRSYRTWPRFNVQPPYVEAAISGGVDFFSLANNHSNDWGLAGIAHTLRNMHNAQQIAYYSGRPIYYGGLGYPADPTGDDYAMVDIWKHGWHLGVLVVTHFLNDPVTGAEYVQVADYEKRTEVRHILEFVAQHDQRYDLLIISYHGGQEYTLQPHLPKQRFFRQLAAAGADIIWGHHPHVLQPWELLPRQNDIPALVMYSLGNFVSGQTWFVEATESEIPRAFTGDSHIFQVEYQSRQGRPYLSRIEAVPISHWKDPAGGVEVRSYQDLLSAQDIGAAWHAYYSSRNRVLQRTFGTRKSIVFPPPYIVYY